MKNRQTVSRHHTTINEETLTIINEINCDDIGTLKWYIIHVISKWTAIFTMYDVII